MSVDGKRHLLRCEAAGALTGLASFLRGKKHDPAVQKIACEQLLISADEYLEAVKRLEGKEATMEIELKEVQSSNITHIGYDAATQTLIVKFKGSGKYSYAPVPQEKFDALMLAESKGKYFAAEIRSAKDGDGKPLHLATKIEEKAEEPVAV